MTAALVEAGYDAARSGTLTVTITETGGGAHVKTATLTGQYMPENGLSSITVMDDDGYELAVPFGYSSMISALNAAFSTGLSSVITASIVGGKWRFSSNGAGGVASIAVTFNAAAERYFSTGGAVYSGALAHTMFGYASRYIIPANGGLAELTEPYEVATDLAVDNVANDGGAEGLCMHGAALEMECLIPLEPAERVWHGWGNDVGGEALWHVLFRQARNIEPISITYDDGTLVRRYVCRLTAEGAAYAPEQLSEGYLAFADIRLRMRFLGSVT